MPEDHSAAGLARMKDFTEEKVDKMRTQKDKELDDYRAEQERAKRNEKSKLLQKQQRQ